MRLLASWFFCASTVERFCSRAVRVVLAKASFWARSCRLVCSSASDWRIASTKSSPLEGAFAATSGTGGCAFRTGSARSHRVQSAMRFQGRGNRRWMREERPVHDMTGTGVGVLVWTWMIRPRL